MRTRILNILIAFAIVIGFLPQHAFAIEEKTKTYVYDNYTVDYNITDSWDDTQNITIYVTNTGSEPIENWMLAYAFKGEVYDIWNAEVKQNVDGISYIKNLGYNNIIEPGSTISFGYALYNAVGFPDNIAMCQKRVTKESGFDVVLNVLDSWEDNFKGEITIQNNTDTAIECWELSFDSNFTIVEITDSWAANISNYDDGTYTLKGTYTNVIYANSNVTLGFMGIKSGDPEIIDYTLTEVVADEINIPKEKEPDDSDDPYVHVDDMYYKPILSNDDIDYDGKGIYFVRNQILVTAYQNVSFEEVKDLAEKYNAEIVGYIWLTNDYQLEFKTDVSTEYLYHQIEEFLNESIIEYASLNIALELEPCFDRPTEGNWDDVDDTDWYLETINAYGAWSEYYDLMSDVNLGIIDQAFYTEHEDLKDKFSEDRLWENPAYSLDNKIFYHGTHVAGIMAAEFNNGIGISGICPKNSLYAFSVHPIIRNGIPKDTSIMQFKIAFATLIANNVKVINISLDDNLEVCIGATHGNANALNYINDASTIFGKFIQKIIDLEYDFLIVSCAGNTNDKPYIEDDNAPYGFKENKSKGKIMGARAEYLSFWNYIGYDNTNTEFKDVRNRIIVVGSINDKYKYSEFSNVGDRVDIVAPGENIFSTVDPSTATHKNGYRFMGGTSMAAPQVAGVAGMIYSLKPGLKADEVKRIIIDSARAGARNDSNRVIIHYIQDENIKYGFVLYVLDAKTALDMAMGKVADDVPDDTNKAIVYGTVLYENEEPAENINICAESKDTSEKYYFNTDEDGNYVMALEPGKYKILFSNIKYITDDYDFPDWIITYLLNHNPEYAFHIIEEKEIDANTAYELDRVLDNNESKSVDIIDYYGKELVGIEMEIRDALNNKTYAITINNNVFKYADLKDGEYTLSASKPGYVPQTLNATAKDGMLYDESENVLEQIVLIPQSTIIGRVTERNTTTQKIKPIAGYTVNILQNGEVIASGITGSDGSYKIVIGAYGDIIVAFGDDERPIYAAGKEYEENKEFLTSDSEDDDDDDDDNNDDGDNENDNNENNEDSGWDIDGAEDDGIIINFGEDGDPSYTGDQNGNMNNGFWLTTMNSKNQKYYVHIYTTPDSGEFTSTFGSPGWGLYTTMYHYWTHELKMETYDPSGKLLSDIRLAYFYEKTYISLWGDRPLMQVDSVTSAAIYDNRITYNMHTDGYYKEYYNLFGSLGVKQMDWTDDAEKTTYFYNNSTLIGASSHSPFNIED